MKYEIEVYDHSPQYEDARNPSKRLMIISDIECALLDFLILCRKVRSIWPEGSNIELFASETQVGSKQIEWKE